jgi:hypothetical protein
MGISQAELDEIEAAISVMPPKIVAISVADGRPSRRHRSLAVLGVGLGCLIPHPIISPGSPSSPAGAARDPFRDTGRYHLQYRTLVSPGGPMTGPCHYRRAEEILAEIEAANALSNETETALAIRAQAHATLALAAATAIDPDRQREEWRDVAGGRCTDT